MDHHLSNTELSPSKFDVKSGTRPFYSTYLHQFSAFTNVRLAGGNGPAAESNTLQRSMLAGRLNYLYTQAHAMADDTYFSAL